jgi:hypothetical protein
MHAEALPGSLDLHCRFFSAIAAAGQVSAQSRHVPFTVQEQDQHGDVCGGTSERALAGSRRRGSSGSCAEVGLVLNALLAG